MKIIDKRVYTGKNVHSHKTCIRLTVDVENLYDTPTKEIEGFNKRLVDALPGLKKHHCALGYEGGFLDRLDEGTYLPHVYEHMIIEMQNDLGYKDIRYGKARCIEGSIYQIIFQYEFDEAALLCADTALSCVNNFISGNDFDMKSAMEKIEKKISTRRLGPSTKGIYDEAIRRGLPIIRIGNDSIFQLGYGAAQRRIEATLTGKTSCIGVDIACDKALTREVLLCAALPVAAGDVACNIQEALDICRKVGYPVVIKPANGCQGNGVSVDIIDDKSAVLAYNEACRKNYRVIVEKYIDGKDYRVLVVNGKVSAVALRTPPSVIGDGIHNIMDLIEFENENPLRGYDHEKPLTKIIVDDIMINYLKSKGLSLANVPEKGEEIVLRFNANLSTGGTSRDCTEIIHPDNIDIAIKAAEVVGLDVAGIDICSNDISKPLKENGGVILEVNAAPGIRMHMYPTHGKPRNIPADILDYLYEDGAKSIPVVSITGTNGKTTVTRMIAHILSMKGLCVGMTTTSGIYIDNRKIVKGDTTGPDSARVILTDKRVEAAVLETARGGILRRGLGYDLADVGVITNISEDHLGLDEVYTMEDLANVKSLVVEAVKKNGYAILNADDPYVNLLSQRVKCRIIYYSRNLENLLIKKHLMEGGASVYLKDGFICFASDGKVQPFINVTEIPSTMDGRLEYNIENSMAAAGACIGLNIDLEVIAKGLRSFILDNTQNPGRFNVHNLDNFKVVVDYGHNIGSFTAVLSGLKNIEANRLVGVVGVPGDRTDESTIRVGQISGKGFDYIYIKEDMDKRGRAEGEVAALLEQGVISAGRMRADYRIILNETEALLYAMEHAQSGDVITVFYEDYDAIMKTIERYKNEHSKVEVKSMEKIEEVV